MNNLKNGYDIDPYCSKCAIYKKCIKKKSTKAQCQTRQTIKLANFNFTYGTYTQKLNLEKKYI